MNVAMFAIEANIREIVFLEVLSRPPDHLNLYIVISGAIIELLLILSVIIFYALRMILVELCRFSY